MNILDFIVTALLTGPWLWLGVALGLTGAWLAYVYLPETIDRASIGALVFIAGCILGMALGSMANKRK
jgi:hypothetical protein